MPGFPFVQDTLYFKNNLSLFNMKYNVFKSQLGIKKLKPIRVQCDTSEEHFSNVGTLETLRRR